MSDLLWVSDAFFAPTGYGKVTKNLLKYSKLDIATIAHQHIGQMIEVDGRRVYGSKADPYSRDVLEKVMALEKPKAVVTMFDIGHQRAVSEIMKRHLDIAWYPYVPVDFHNMVPWMNDCLKYARCVITMSEHGRNVLKESGIDAKVIPLGVDTRKYKPIGVVNYKKQFGLDGKFCVLTVGRNQRRKMLDKIIQGFAIFAESKDDVMLMLHTSENPENKSGFNLKQILTKYGLDGKYIFTYPQMDPDWRSDFPEERMITLYNMADVGVYAGNEGFGLPIIEQLSCGKPVVVGDQCNMREIAPPKAAFHAKIIYPYGGQTGIEWGIPSPSSIAEGLELYYRERKNIERHGMYGRSYLKKHYDWRQVINQWTNLIQ